MPLYNTLRIITEFAFVDCDVSWHSSIVYYLAVDKYMHVLYKLDLHVVYVKRNLSSNPLNVVNITIFSKYEFSFCS